MILGLQIKNQYITNFGNIASKKEVLTLVSKMGTKFEPEDKSEAIPNVNFIDNVSKNVEHINPFYDSNADFVCNKLVLNYMSLTFALTLHILETESMNAGNQIQNLNAESDVNAAIDSINKSTSLLPVKFATRYNKIIEKNKELASEVMSFNFDKESFENEQYLKNISSLMSKINNGMLVLQKINDVY